MGHLIGDKKAVHVTVPAGTYAHGDLFRISGFTGFLINPVAVGDTARVRALEIAMNRCWSVLTPVIAPAVGDLLYWTTGSGTKRGDTDLTVTPTGSAVAKVVATRNAAGYIQVVLVDNGSGAQGVSQQSAIVHLTDNSGGVAVDNTVAAVTSSATAADAVKELTVKVNAILAALEGAGVIAP